MDSQCSSSVGSRATVAGVVSINSTPISARVESYEAGEKKCISDVRRTFCLFVTFDLLFVTLLWIIELNLLAVFRFAVLILVYAVCKLRHWWAIAITTAITTGFLIVKVIVSKLLSQGAFGYLLPIISFVLAWIETWLLDFKVLPQEAGDEIRHISVQSAEGREPLLYPGPVSEGQFYSPPESMADSDEDFDDKHDLQKPIV
ncbi:STARD3 N-terminal-like protein isoform X2 [Myxocyprinus asiaticus]|uniref:STARD3 N-terminal-like protein isoform X2 n=1 Tax=Myxocyprinus asiaticus TaxID=70543 RepID=UPI0022226F84|nr:STARD3 N-terminal-like protein isoform X2 [Myxocyprinus asiaticus]